MALLPDKGERPSAPIKEVAGCPGYFVGEDGAVWSTRDSRGKSYSRWARLSPFRRKEGMRYSIVAMRPVPCGRLVHRYLHRLVLETFVGPCPLGMECLHEDHDTANNALVNLRWGTHQENVEQTVRKGRNPRGSRFGHAKLHERDIPVIRQLVAQGIPQHKIGARFGVVQSLISAIVRGKIWTHVPIIEAQQQ